MNLLQFALLLLISVLLWHLNVLCSALLDCFSSQNHVLLLKVFLFMLLPLMSITQNQIKTPVLCTKAVIYLQDNQVAEIEKLPCYWSLQPGLRLLNWGLRLLCSAQGACLQQMLFCHTWLLLVWQGQSSNRLPVLSLLNLVKSQSWWFR